MTAQYSELKALSALQAQREAESFNLNKATLFSALELAGVTRITVTFDGYGDSGQIENVEVQAGDCAMLMPDAIIEITEAVWGQAALRYSSVNIATAVESLAYDTLTQTHDGWENNDGAFGDIVFDVPEHMVTLDYNERYTTSENYTHRF